MDIFNLNFPEDNKDKSKFENLTNWFDFMNNQFEKIEEMQNTNKINNVLSDNDIDLI